MSRHQPLLAPFVTERRALEQGVLLGGAERGRGFDLPDQVPQGAGIAVERIRSPVIGMLVAQSPHYSDFTTGFNSAPGPPRRQCSTFYIAGRRVDCHTRSVRKRSVLPFGFALL